MFFKLSRIVLHKRPFILLLQRIQTMSKSCASSITQDSYGAVEDKDGNCREIKRFTLKNANSFQVQVITYGGTITSIMFPDKNCKIQDIVLGYNDIDGYLSKSNPNFGATIGRCANRIKDASMIIEGKEYKLTKNERNHHLHGGKLHFGKVIWDSYVKGSKLILSYYSKHLEEGFPGNVVVNISFELNDCNYLILVITAMTDKPTIVNITHHSYFNLAGHNAGRDEIYKHLVCINADKYVETDDENIPTGNLCSVKGTPFDFLTPKQLSCAICASPNRGFDHNFVVNKCGRNDDNEEDENFVARVQHRKSGRIMEVYSNQPGVQFFTGNCIKEPDGKAFYDEQCGLCLEPQIHPDAIHHKKFPDPVLRPGELYRNVIIYKFLHSE